MINKNKRRQIQLDSETRWQKKLTLLNAKITQKWDFDTRQKLLQDFEIGPKFCETYVIRHTILYTPASHPFVHLLIITVELHAF